jgi:hypothetical protein
MMMTEEGAGAEVITSTGSGTVATTAAIMVVTIVMIADREG